MKLVDATDKDTAFTFLWDERDDALVRALMSCSRTRRAV